MDRPTMSLMMVVAAMLLLATVSTEAARIDTYGATGCQGASTYTFMTGGNSCTTFGDESSVKIGEISATTRVSVHNQKDCETKSMVGQFYGPGCLTQGATKLRAVYIAG